MFVLVEWILENQFSIISYKSIESPRKEYFEYAVGEEVTAKFNGKTYPAKIVKKSHSKADLQTEFQAPKKGVPLAVAKVSATDAPKAINRTKSSQSQGSKSPAENLPSPSNSTEEAKDRPVKRKQTVPKSSEKDDPLLKDKCVKEEALKLLQKRRDQPRENRKPLCDPPLENQTGTNSKGKTSGIEGKISEDENKSKKQQKMPVEESMRVSPSKTKKCEELETEDYSSQNESKEKTKVTSRSKMLKGSPRRTSPRKMLKTLDTYDSAVTTISVSNSEDRNPEPSPRRKSPRKLMKRFDDYKISRDNVNESSEETEPLKYQIQYMEASPRRTSPRKMLKTLDKYDSAVTTISVSNSEDRYPEPSPRRKSPRKLVKRFGDYKITQDNVSESSEETEHLKYQIQYMEASPRRTSPKKTVKKLDEYENNKTYDSERESEEESKFQKIPKKLVDTSSRRKSPRKLMNRPNVYESKVRFESQSESEEETNLKRCREKSVRSKSPRKSLDRTCHSVIYSDSSFMESEDESQVSKHTPSEWRHCSEEDMFGRIHQSLKTIEKKLKILPQLEAKVHKLEKDLKRVKKTSTIPEPEEMEQSYFGNSASSLKESIKYSTNFQTAVKSVFLQTFGKNYIISHSIQGRKPNSKVDAKEAFDKTTLNFLVKILMEQFPGKVESDVKDKLQNLQKTLRSQEKK